jgi:molybdate transport system substrate-binding protein
MSWKALGLAVVLLFASCSSSRSDERGEPLVVFAASSLTEAFREIKPAASFNFAGSDDLAAQIREGALADVYASADPDYARELFDEGLVERPRVFARNTLVLVVPVDNPGRIESVSDVARPGIKLVVGAPGVPAGDYARAALARLDEARALRNIVSEEQDVKGVIGKVALGEADAGFVYATDVPSVADKVRTIELPSSAQPAISYSIAAVTDTHHRAEASAFIRLVLSGRGRSALRKAGFRLP